MLCPECYKIHIYRVKSALQVDVDRGWRLDVIMTIATIPRSFMGSSLIIFGYCVDLVGSVFGNLGI